MPRKTCSVLDFVIIAIITLIALGLCAHFYASNNAKQNLYVEIASQTETYLFALEQERTICVQGINGTTQISIQNGAVQFDDSVCPNKTCVYAKAISKPNQWIMCLPNGIYARIIAE